MPEPPVAAEEKRKEESRSAVSQSQTAPEPPPPPEAEFAPAAPDDPMRKDDDKLRELKASAQAKAAQSRGEEGAESRSDVRARRAPTVSESSGGEAALPGSSAMVLEEPAPSPKLTILSWDGAGSPPECLRPLPPLPPEYRGRQYILMVDALGRVQSVKPYARRGKARADEAYAYDAVEPAIPEALKRLRFAPGDRARRLLVRIE